jgi:hypothetical protein
MSPDNYIEELAREIRAAVPAEAMPTGDTEPLFLMYAVLALARGVRVSRKDVHNAWAAWMTLKDPSHEALRPYEDLDEATQAEDDPFVFAIRRASAGRRSKA